MNIPRELFEEILSYLSPDNQYDQWWLQNCSLVAKSWANPCRRRLFKTVNICDETLLSWLDSIPPTNDELLRHTRSLSYVTNTSGWHFGEHCVDVLRDYLPSFHQLQHLTLSSVQVPSDISEQVDMFSAFRHTLSRLSLGNCYVTTSALVTLVNYFPRLDRVDLLYLWNGVDDEPAPPISHPPMQELHVSEFYPHRDAFHTFHRLSELGPLFDEVVLEGRSQVLLSELSHIAGTLGVNTKRLRLLQHLAVDQPDDGPTLLSRFQELRELELVVAYPGIEEADIISSIRSTHIQKVSIIYEFWVVNPPLRNSIDWKIFDKPLCRLVDQLGCTRGLEVGFRITAKEGADARRNTLVARILDSLAGFRVKGQIRVVWVDLDGNEGVVHPIAPTPVE